MVDNLALYLGRRQLADVLAFDALYRRILDTAGVIREFGTAGPGTTTRHRPEFGRGDTQLKELSPPAGCGLPDAVRRPPDYEGCPAKPERYAAGSMVLRIDELSSEATPICLMAEPRREPNRLLAEARRRVPSPSGAPRPMSRQELAEAVNTYLWEHRRIREQLDRTDIGKLERGVVRWPREHRREALRAVLAAASDAELGLYIGHPGQDGWPVAGEGPGAPASTPELALDTSELARHWAGMLDLLAATGNALGVRDLMDVVQNEITLIDDHRRAAGGRPWRELAVVAARWREFGSWVADNRGQPGRARHQLEEAGSLALAAGHAELSAYVAMRGAQRAVEAREPDRAAGLADPVMGDSRLAPRIRALAAVRHAQAHAQLSDARAVRTSLGAAYRLVDRATAAEEPEVAAIAGHCTSTYVRGYEALCRLLLGEPAAAAEDLAMVLAGWPLEQRLDEGLFRANLAVALWAAGQREAADAEATVAREIGVRTGSRRIVAVLDGLVVPAPALRRTATSDRRTPLVLEGYPSAGKLGGWT